MIPVKPANLRQYADVLRLRTGASMTVRFVEPADVDGLRAYIEKLRAAPTTAVFWVRPAVCRRRNTSGCCEPAKASHFAVVAEIGSGPARTIVGEARYVFDAATGAVEFAISVGDDWHGTGAGSALLSKSRMPRRRTRRTHDLRRRARHQSGNARPGEEAWLSLQPSAGRLDPRAFHEGYSHRARHSLHSVQPSGAAARGRWLSRRAAPIVRSKSEK